MGAIAPFFDFGCYIEPERVVEIRPDFADMMQ